VAEDLEQRVRGPTAPGVEIRRAPVNMLTLSEVDVHDERLRLEAGGGIHGSEDGPYAGRAPRRILAPEARVEWGMQREAQPELALCARERLALARRREGVGSFRFEE
jgi:hypothetical protein